MSILRFSDIIEQAKALLQRQGRLTYRSLKREFALEDEALEDLKFELIEGQRVATDEDGKVLVWKESAANQEVEHRRSEEAELRHRPSLADSQTDGRKDSSRTEAERRQLTVMFCDLVGSTTLSEHLDPEEYHEVVSRYQETCTAVIKRYAGHIAQHLGDGLLVYFGYPVAHEDDAQRAVRTGLEIVTELSSLNAQLPSTIKAQLPHPLQVRIGVHTGLVVIGEIGSSEKREILAMGETPNIAARVQGVAEPDTVVMSTITQRLVAGLFDCQELGARPLKGIAAPVTLYRVVGESNIQHRLDVALPTGLTPLIGREEELALLQRRWEQVKDREGQVVLLSGEPGIGKSRLVRELRDRVEQDHGLRLEFRCSPYYQNSAWQPVIEHLHRLLNWRKDETPQTKLDKLQTTLTRYQFPQSDTFALFAALLALPHPPDAPPLNMSPQRQKQKTEEALISWLVEESERAPLYCAWEDLHWADPSTLELLGKLIDQIPTTQLFVLLTSRPEFTPPWGQHGHFSQLTLSRLGKRQAPQMIARVAGNKPLPEEVVQQIVVKTDGVPLFMEELTKMVLESGLLTETDDHYELRGPLPPLAIPSTLQDSLMARLDRLATTKEIAQLGATLGREFAYDLLQAVSPMDEPTLQQGLQQLVVAELLYQRGTPPHANYIFKHALIQDTAYQSLLKSKRQQLHQQIARVLEEQFPDTKDTQPELLARHYTEAGLISQAIPYWQQAGQQAALRSANGEASNHLSKGIELLKTLPSTSELIQLELVLQMALGPVLVATKGHAAPEVENAYTKALALCRQAGETSQLFPALFGLRQLYILQAKFQTAYKLGEQLLDLAERVPDSAFLLEAHRAVGEALLWMGESSLALKHLEQSRALYDPHKHHSHAFLYGLDPGVVCSSFAAIALWHLGYPDQALKRAQEALTLAGESPHLLSLAFALSFTAMIYQHRREWRPGQEQTEAALALSREQGFLFYEALNIWTRGVTLAEQGHTAEGLAQMRQGISAWRATGVEWGQAYQSAPLADTCGKVGQPEEGLQVLSNALVATDKNGERWYEADLYRIKGELTLQLGTRDWRLETSSPAPQASSSKPLVQSAAEEAEECFLKAIEISQKQQAKSLELRAVMSLARLKQRQGKAAEAQQQLAEIYGWFTEGFDTKDLQEAKALLEQLT